MNIKDFTIRRKTQEEELKEHLFNSLFEVEKYNIAYTTGAIDMLNCLLQVGKEQAWSQKELLYALESYQDNDSVLKSNVLKKYLDILIQNHTS